MAKPSGPVSGEPAVAASDHDADYAAFLAAVRATFAATVGTPGAPLFETEGPDLWSAFLDALPSDRQHHTCSVCRRFVSRFGGLVTASKRGTLHAAMWDPVRVPAFYREAVTRMQRLVTDAHVSGVHLSAVPRLGTPERGGWTHLSVDGAPVFHHALWTPGQAAAAKRHDHATVARALGELTAPMLAQARRLLKADALSRSERFIGPVTWLAALHADRAKAADGRQRDRILWQAVATAPDGYCHPRASVVGSLLEDIAAGLPFEDIKARFAAKLHPLRYQRPQAAPTAGNIAQAEKMFQQMGLAPSLARRFARLDEVETVWRPPTPKPAAPGGAGVFAHLRAKPKSGGVPPVSLPEATMTWEKFTRTVLLAEPDAIEFLVPAHGNFTGLVTAMHDDAPPILRWDRPEKRNPVSSYIYHGGSKAPQWGLTGGTWCMVTGITRRPNEWGDSPRTYLGQGSILILAGAADAGLTEAALFPETLRAELFPIRATIEAYSKSTPATGLAEASACGFGLDGGAIAIQLRVTTGGEAQVFTIDRWD